MIEEKVGIHKKENVASMPVSLEAITIRLEIELHEGRYVAKIDIKGLYLHMESDKAVIIILKGIMA